VQIHYHSALEHHGDGGSYFPTVPEAVHEGVSHGFESLVDIAFRFQLNTPPP
jgi:hypothetical protein